MCGIAGFWHAGGLTDEAGAVIQRMTDAIRHRGPDGDGIWVDQEAGIALGHRRLSILDLSSAGDQPMASASGRYQMVFNGEIYNWPALRLEEERHGARWLGHSDTEVFLAVCDRIGIEAAIRRCSGMFAMAIWDRKERALTLVRDRMGEKPLYYGWCGKTLLFGSELKALRAHPSWVGEIDRGALSLYMRHNYVPGPYSIYQGMNKLPPGTLVTFVADGHRTPEPTPYWSAREMMHAGLETPFDGRPEEIADALELLLRRVIGEEMVADVPLGAFLSGGVDSSLVVALMQAQSARPIKTFTIGFHETDFNEAVYAKAVAEHLGTEHHELYVTPQDALNVVPQLAGMFDEPFADSSQIPTYLVAHLTRQQVTVALSGDGGDEAFGGYERYFSIPKLWETLAPIPRPIRNAAAHMAWAISPSWWDRILRLVPLDHVTRLNGDRIHRVAGLLEARNRRELYYALNSHWRDPASVVIGGFEPLTVLNDPSQVPHFADYTSEMMAMDTMAYLPDDILVKVDRASMAASLETRAPLLHHELMAFAWRVPPGQRGHGKRGKLPLREVLYRHVPARLIERPKVGFAVPIDSWLRGPLKPWAEEMLTPDRLKAAGLFEVAPIRKLWADHQSGRRNRQYLLWDVLMAMSWHDANRAGFQ